MRCTYFKIFVFFTTMVILNGCLYPESELAKNQSPYEDQLNMVQTAVEQYSEETGGLMPIKTKSNDTDIFEKYLIDFEKLKERNLLSELPGNAYENGGVYQYTIITPEDNPRVKLIDLRNTEELRSAVIRLETYRSKNIYPPFGEKIDENVFKIDYEKLGFNSEPQIQSPFSGENLPIIMDTDGNLYIDYRIDLNNFLNEYEHSYTTGDDIRYILPDHSPFVPAYSLPYTIENNEPVFLTH